MRKSVIQVFGFLISTLGWLFVSCTVAMDYWRITYIGGKAGNWIIKATWYWSNLWKDCLTDTTSVTNCRDYDVLWAVTSYVQGVRGLLMIGMSLGFFAAILCFIGMDCTYIGGNEATKDKILLSGAVFHFFGGLSDLAAYCLYTNKVATMAFAPSLERSAVRYEIGTPIFVGLVGSFFIILGSVLYAVTLIPKRTMHAFASRTLTEPQTYAQQMRSKKLSNGGYYTSARRSRPSRPLSQTSSSQISRISQVTENKISDRDTFV